MNPIIGIVTTGIENQRHFIPNTYINAATTCGFTPILLPITNSTEHMISYTHLCDAFLFCGGNDITPHLYGQIPKDNSGLTDMILDNFHITFMKYALATKKPLVGICRGMQVLNIALGGTLYQDLAKEYVSPSTNLPLMQHMQNSRLRSDVSHEVCFRPHTKMYHLLGPSIYTNTYHHQAINALGNNLIASGSSKDGVIESIEVINHPFCIGVQWHPECLLDTLKNCI